MTFAPMQATDCVIVNSLDALVASEKRFACIYADVPCGRLPFPLNTQRSWVIAPRTKHSTKPDRIRAIVEQVSPGPRLELFARRTTPGWTVLGD